MVHHKKRANWDFGAKNILLLFLVSLITVVQPLASSMLSRQLEVVVTGNS
jgi:hypothetical protein